MATIGIKTANGNVMGGDTRGLVTSAGMTMPDYGSGSVVPGSYSTNTNFSWTATETGYILALLSGAGGTNVRIIVQINGSSIDRIVSSTGAADTLNGVYAIEKGDVFTFINEFSTPGNLLYFMLPKIVQTIPPMISGRGALVSGGAFQFDADGNGFTDNFSEAETQVGWYTRANGEKKPIYRRAFTGYAVGAANTIVSVILMTGVDAIVGYGGSWQRGNGTYEYPMGMYFTVSMAVPTATNVQTSNLVVGRGSGTTDGQLVFGSLSDVARTGTSNNAYRIWVEYTKL
jgi:hypothetical protein